MIIVSKMWDLKKEESWIILLYIKFLLQDVNICGPMDHSCYSRISAKSFACRPSCTSLYADVHFTDENSTASQKRVFKKFRRLTDLYNTYKNQIALNLDFSPSGSLNQSESMVNNKSQPHSTPFPVPLLLCDAQGTPVLWC